LTSITSALVSVVMPCYNGRAYLAAAIDSVLVQDYRPLELIVVDDGSTDGSGDVARGFGPAVVVLDQANLGVAAARNTGLERATGEYVAFCDADDLWTPGSLRARVAALEAPPPCDYAYGMVANFLSPDVDQERARSLVFPREPIMGRTAGSLLIRRAALDVVGPFDITRGAAEFVDWVSRIASAGLVGRSVAGVVLRRRVHGSNTTLRSPAKSRDYIRALRDTLDRRRAGTR
jgi:glycosyltransferase involved in cell wall biosynthesis